MAYRFKDEKDMAKVEGLRRKPSRPEYMSAGLRQRIEISEDFESVLILMPPSTREEARQHLRQQDEPVDRIKRRDAILGTALGIDIDNATAQDEEIQNSLQQFQTLIGKLNSFGEVAETALLVRDLQIDKDEAILAGDRAKHRLIVSALIRDRIQTHSVAKEIDEERKSWSAVLGEYS